MYQDIINQDTHYMSLSSTIASAQHKLTNHKETNMTKFKDIEVNSSGVTTQYFAVITPSPLFFSCEG